MEQSIADSAGGVETNVPIVDDESRYLFYLIREQLARNSKEPKIDLLAGGLKIELRLNLPSIAAMIDQ